MKPTTNQLLASCHAGFVSKHFRDWSPAALFSVIMGDLDESEVESYIKLATSPASWTIEVNIAPFYTSQYGVTIPLLAITNHVQVALALSWCLNPEHDCDLVRLPGSMNYLCQAIECGIPIDCWETEVIKDTNSGHLKERRWLDPGSVALAFELAGIQSPRNLESWRKPNDIDVPSKATIESDPDFGTATVHYHDGLFALVSSADRMQVKLVHLQHIENAATEQLNAFLKTARKSERKAKPAKFEEDAAALVAKWLD